MKANVSRYFESTLLQELEWHFHTALFALVLGFGTIYNTHVRVDLVRDHVSFRKKVWIEFLGLTCFMIPYLLARDLVRLELGACSSYAVGEISASTVGLSHRWVIKSVLVVGLIVATLAGVAVWLQVAMLLWGDSSKRFPLMTLEWPEEAGTKIEGKERIKLEDAPAEAALPPVLARASDETRRVAGRRAASARLPAIAAWWRGRCSSTGRSCSSATSATTSRRPTSSRSGA